MSFLTKLFKWCVPLLLYAFGRELWTVIRLISFEDLYQTTFFASAGAGLVITHLLVRTHGYLAILTHELTHNVLGILTFNKPIALNVEANSGGYFAYQGKQTIISVLSPYFFPLITAVIFPIYFILAGSGAIVYFGMLGFTMGYSFSIAIRQGKPHQPDLHVFGIGWSYTMILFFQILIWGILIAFAVGRIPMISNFFTSAIDHILELYVIIKAGFQLITNNILN
jgi:hypothetical protein